MIKIRCTPFHFHTQHKRRIPPKNDITCKNMTLSKLKFLDDNFYLVTATKKIVMSQENSKGDKKWLLFQH